MNTDKKKPRKTDEEEEDNDDEDNEPKRSFSPSRAPGVAIPNPSKHPPSSTAGRPIPAAWTTMQSVPPSNSYSNSGPSNPYAAPPHLMTFAPSPTTTNTGYPAAIHGPQQYSTASSSLSQTNPMMMQQYSPFAFMQSPPGSMYMSSHLGPGQPQGYISMPSMAALPGGMFMRSSPYTPSAPIAPVVFIQSVPTSSPPPSSSSSSGRGGVSISNNNEDGQDDDNASSKKKRSAAARSMTSHVPPAPVDPRSVGEIRQSLIGADFNGEGRLLIHFEDFGKISHPVPKIGKKGIIPNGISGNFSSYGERWQFLVRYAQVTTTREGKQLVCLDWLMRNDVWDEFHSVVETPHDAMKREDRGVTMCNKVFTDVLEKRAKEYEEIVQQEKDKPDSNALKIANLHSRIKSLRPRRISEGPLLFGLRHKAVHDHFFPEATEPE